MKDRLEKFVDEHRNELDAFEPRPDLWQDISRELHQKKEAKVISFSYTQLWRYAAAILLIIAAGFMIVQLTSRPPQNPVAVTQPLPLQQIAPEMAEVESYYTSLINEKKAELEGYDLKALGIEDNLQQDVAALDSSYKRLKRELYAHDANKEKIIEAMIQNLQLRMEVLNQQLKTLQRIRTIKRDNQNGNIHA
jgi:hypothetical protein